MKVLFVLPYGKGLLRSYDQRGQATLLRRNQHDQLGKRQGIFILRKIAHPREDYPNLPGLREQTRREGGSYNLSVQRIRDVEAV